MLVSSDEIKKESWLLFLAFYIDETEITNNEYMTISPFVRYNFQLRKGNSIFVDCSYKKRVKHAQ